MAPSTTDDALPAPPNGAARTDRLLGDGQSRAAAIDPAHARLWEAVVAATAGGKRFRPALVTAAHDAPGGSCPDAAAAVGAAVELFRPGGVSSKVDGLLYAGASTVPGVGLPMFLISAELVLNRLGGDRSAVPVTG